MSRRSGSYPKELRDRAVRMVAEVRSEHASEWAAMESVASKLGIGSAQTVHNLGEKGGSGRWHTTGDDECGICRNAEASIGKSRAPPGE